MILFYLLVAIMPLTRHWFWSETIVGGLTMNKWLGFICLVVALTQFSMPGMFFFRTVQARLFGLFVLLTIGSFILRGPDTSLEDSSLANFASILLLFFVTLTLVSSVARLRWVLLSVVGGLTFVSLHAIREWQNGGMAGDARPGLIAGDPNYLALSLLLGIPLAFLLATRPAPRTERLFCAASLAIMLIAFALAGSRGGFIGLLATFLVFTWRSPRRLRSLAIGGTLFCFLAVAHSASPITRFLEPSFGDEESNRVRAALLDAGLRMFSENRWIGVGVGNYKPLVGRYGARDVQLKNLAHNSYLEVAAEQGIFGLLLFLAVLYFTFRSLRQTRQRASESRAPFLHTAADGIELGLIGAAAAMLFLSALHARLFWLMVILSMRLPSLVARTRKDRRLTAVQVSSSDAPRSHSEALGQ